MKNVLVVFFLLLTIQSNAQDTIVLKSHSRIVGMVHEIDDAFITYSVPEQDSIYLMVSKNDVQSIHYSSGYRENFDTKMSIAKWIITNAALTTQKNTTLVAPILPKEFLMAF